MVLKNNKSIKFEEKTLLINSLGELRDSDCKFEIINEYTIKVLLRTVDNIRKEIFFNFKESIYSTGLIYEIVVNKRKFKGKIVDNNFKVDLENLNIQIYEFFYTKNNIIIYAVELLPRGYGNKKIIKFYDIDSIDIS